MELTPLLAFKRVYSYLINAGWLAVASDPDLMPDYQFAELTMSLSQPHTSPHAADTTLGRAHDKTEAVQEKVEHSAQELLVINAVLKQELPDHVQTGEVAQALEKSDALEDLMQESADDLAGVNQALEQEIGERVELERELAKTKAALAAATGAPQKP
jgi:phosphoglycerate-specific signal transduction histidine kinase